MKSAVAPRTRKHRWNPVAKQSKDESTHGRRTATRHQKAARNSSKHKNSQEQREELLQNVQG